MVPEPEVPELVEGPKDDVVGVVVWKCGGSEVIERLLSAMK